MLDEIRSSFEFEIGEIVAHRGHIDMADVPQRLVISERLLIDNGDGFRKIYRVRAMISGVEGNGFSTDLIDIPGVELVSYPSHRQISDRMQHQYRNDFDEIEKEANHLLLKEISSCPT